MMMTIQPTRSLMKFEEAVAEVEPPVEEPEGHGAQADEDRAQARSGRPRPSAAACSMSTTSPVREQARHRSFGHVFPIPSPFVRRHLVRP